MFVLIHQSHFLYYDERHNPENEDLLSISLNNDRELDL